MKKQLFYLLNFILISCLFAQTIGAMQLPADFDTYKKAAQLYDHMINPQVGYDKNNNTTIKGYHNYPSTHAASYTAGTLGGTLTKVTDHLWVFALSNDINNQPHTGFVIYNPGATPNAAFWARKDFFPCSMSKEDLIKTFSEAINEFNAGHATNIGDDKYKVTVNSIPLTLITHPNGFSTIYPNLNIHINQASEQQLKQQLLQDHDNHLNNLKILAEQKAKDAQYTQDLKMMIDLFKKTKNWEAEKHGAITFFKSNPHAKKAIMDNNTTFAYYAAKYAPYDLIKIVIDENLINQCDENGNTPLIIAVLNTNVDAIRALLEYKADANLANKKGETPLMIAIKNNMSAVIKPLLEKVTDINATNSDEQTALIIAAQNNNTQAGQQLLNRPGIDINKSDKNGKTALSYAMDLTDLSLLKSLIEHGANLQPILSSPKAAHKAKTNTNTSKEQFEIIKKHLIDTLLPLDLGMDSKDSLAKIKAAIGIDIADISPKLQHQILWEACSAKKLGLIQAMLTLDSLDTIEHILQVFSNNIIVNGNVDAFNIFVNSQRLSEHFKDDKRNKVFFNEPIMPGGGAPELPLNLCIKNDNLAMTKFMLEHQADPNKDNKGYTPFHYLVKNYTGNNAEGFINLLIAHNASINKDNELVDKKDKKQQNAKNKNNSNMRLSPLALAFMNNVDENTLSLLIKNGAVIIGDMSPDMLRDKLLKAYSAKKLDLVQEILKSSSLKGEDIIPVFSDVIIKGDSDTFKIFVESNKFDSKFKTDFFNKPLTGLSDQQTPLTLCIQNNNLAMVELMLKYQTDSNKPNSLLHYVVKQYTGENTEKLVNLLLKHGADINNVENGFFPLAFAVFNNKKDMISLLLKKGADIKNLYQIPMKTGDLATVELILKNQTDPYKANSLLHYLVTEYQGKNTEKFIDLLLKYGADINKLGDDNLSPLALAVRNSKIDRGEVITLLLKKGADITALSDDDYAWLPQSALIKYGYPNMSAQVPQQISPFLSNLSADTHSMDGYHNLL